MTDQIKSLFGDLAVLPVVSPSVASVRRRRQQRQRHVYVSTGIALVLLAAGAATVTIAAEANSPKTATSTTAPGILAPLAKTVGYPSSFLAVHGLPGEQRIAQYDSMSGTFRRDLTEIGTDSPAVGDGILYYLKHEAPCRSSIWAQPLVGGAVRKVFGPVARVDALTANTGHLAWLASAVCPTKNVKSGVSRAAAQLAGEDNIGLELHVQYRRSGATQTYAFGRASSTVFSLSVGPDGRVAFLRFHNVSKAADGWHPYGPDLYVQDLSQAGDARAPRLIDHPNGCAFTAVAWINSNLVSAASCLNESTDIFSISGTTFVSTKSSIHLVGSITDLATAEDGALLTRMTHGSAGSDVAVTGPVVRLQGNTETPIPPPNCDRGVDCGTDLREAVWLE